MKLIQKKKICSIDTKYLIITITISDDDNYLKMIILHAVILNHILELHYLVNQVR